MRSIENKATFFVPTSDGGDTAFKLAKEATRLFGGATLIPASGLWMNAFKNVEQDSINLVVVFAPQSKRREFTTFVEDSVKAIGVTLDEETVAVEVNGFLGLYDKANGYV